MGMVVLNQTGESMNNVKLSILSRVLRTDKNAKLLSDALNEKKITHKFITDTLKEINYGFTSRVSSLVNFANSECDVKPFTEYEIKRVAAVLEDMGAFDDDVSDLLGNYNEPDKYIEFVKRMSTGVVPASGGSTYTADDVKFINDTYHIVRDCDGDIPKIRLYRMTYIYLIYEVLERIQTHKGNCYD